MGQFSLEKLVLPGSTLSGNQQPIASLDQCIFILDGFPLITAL
jgi:hypothetical protein